MVEQIEIIDVAPRDGLQSQPKLVDTNTKIELVKRLIEAGVGRIEVVSFVNPKRVPQMADAEEVIKLLPKRDDVTYIGLVLNMRGFERAVKSKIDEINCVVVASDTFNQRNQGVTTEQTMQSIEEIAIQSKSTELTCGVTISAAFGCPFEGEVPVSRVVELAKRLINMGIDEIVLADTIGAAGPSDVSKVVSSVREVTGDTPLRCHFHNTRNTGVANVYAAIMEGVRKFDASCGGVGGCPFAPSATGNVATEDLLYMIHRMGFETGISIEGIMETARWLEGPLETQMPAMVTRAGLFPSNAVHDGAN
ncbi:MAG: hydroxymethylglutaryl-CoA lyase [Gammaproteobacteria bacterium]|nr:hydroxymethylglutaryl-CoA lyase [Gammaproteobacteria bacterium]